MDPVESAPAQTATARTVAESKAARSSWEGREYGGKVDLGMKESSNFMWGGGGEGHINDIGFTFLQEGVVLGLCKLVRAECVRQHNKVAIILGIISLLSSLQAFCSEPPY